VDMAMEYGYGCGPTQALIDRLVTTKGDKAAGFAYTFTIVTDRGDYEIDGAVQIENVDREFLTILLSRSADSAPSERVYVRLCSIRAIQEHYNKE
jgi:hypothetical protein